MNYLSLSRPFVVARATSASHLIGSCLSRGLATAQKSNKLPLAGVKVLDMSRVLAGVSSNLTYDDHFDVYFLTSSLMLLIAVLHTDLRRSRVCIIHFLVIDANEE
jgi:hypothetical protein